MPIAEPRTPAPNKRQSCQIEQALNRSVFAKGAVHHRENDVDALAAAASVQLYKRRIGGVRGHHHSLATLQDFRQHFLRVGADQPVALLADADGTASYLSGSRPRITEAADARETSCSPERPPKRIPTRSLFLFSGVMGVVSCQFLVISEKTELVGRLFLVGF